MNSDYLTIPNPLKNLAPIQYDIRLVVAAENRVGDIAIVNPMNGQELLALFSRAAFSLSKICSDLQLQHNLIQKRMGDRAAIMTVDIIPEKAKSRGLPQTMVTRQAFLDLDEEYSSAHNIEMAIEAAVTYVDKQLKAMEGALSSIKKIFDSNNSVYRRPNPNLPQVPGSIPSFTEASPEPVAPRSPDPVEQSPNTTRRYGKANYGSTNYE